MTQDTQSLAQSVRTATKQPWSCELLIPHLDLSLVILMNVELGGSL